MSQPRVANLLGPRAFFKHLSDLTRTMTGNSKKKLGFGGFGFTALVRRKKPSGEPQQRMAIKFIVGTSPARWQTLIREIDILKIVNGASHIVSILANCEDIVEAAADWVSPGDDSVQTPLSAVFTGFVGLTGPALALEYLEHGDIAGLMNKLRRAGRTVPNRILWSFFFCLIRASIGMAYPPTQPIGSDVQILDELPADHSPETEGRMAHNDFNTRNIMLTVGDGPEHGIGVKAKLIDFGLTAPRYEFGSQKNIFDAAETITSMATVLVAGIANTTCDYKGFKTRAVHLLSTDDAPLPLPWLDPDLRDFLARCMYESLQRPKLQEALQITQNAVISKTAESFPVPRMETDSAIDSFVQVYIFDVPQE
ncbi:kinase-like protein [Xylaria arbuscula]|nr:kinase-like protein [Xylaria arbuscula]